MPQKPFTPGSPQVGPGATNKEALAKSAKDALEKASKSN